MDSLSTEDIATAKTRPDGTSAGDTIDNADQSAPAGSKHDLAKAARKKWFNALKNVLPIYISIHLAFFVITCLAVLFIIPDFSWKALPIDTLWQSWYRWDSVHFSYLATHGYSDWWRTAFFPLFPLLERYLAVVTGDPFIAGLIISNVAGLGMLVVLYRLVEEDFDSERAYRTALYLSVFPTAFFFAAAYTESLFLLLALLGFYYMRQGNWWPAGACGFFATLTRSTGLLLLMPFCYEYLRQHQFKLRTLRFDVFGGALIVAGLGLFMLYCYHRFHSFFPFSQAEHFMWSRDPQSPWFLIKNVIAGIAQSNGFLSFHALRNIIDASQILLILALIILSVVGPWRFPTNLWVYAIYGIMLFVVLQINPVKVNPIRGPFPLQSFPRYMLEVFPVFIVLAALGKYRTVHLSYLMVSGVVLFVLLSLFLTGHWVV
jgi:Gpi18-like mannosyltransferase